MSGDIEIYGLPRTPGGMRKLFAGMQVLDDGDAMGFLRRVDEVCLGQEGWQIIERNGGDQVIFNRVGGEGNETQVVGRYIIVSDRTRTGVERGIARAMCDVLDNVFLQNARSGKPTNVVEEWGGLVRKAVELTQTRGNVRVIAPAGLPNFLKRYNQSG